MNSTFKIFNATELWHRENSVPSIPTFSQSLDNVIGDNGLRLCTLTELLGLPGTGKTQLCLQLCASVQIPKALGGLSSEALFIDTNTNFTLSRFKEILSASVLRCQKLLDSSLHINEEDALKRLHYVNAFGLKKFCAFMQRMPGFIAENPSIKLIIIDSIAFPFKEGISEKQRTGLLFRQMAELQKLAVQKQIAVVVTNEMSTRVGLGGGACVGALGDAWAHRCNARVVLCARARAHPRLALRVKGTADRAHAATFQITPDGIRDVD